MSEGKKLVPALRFPKFHRTTRWKECAGGDLFDQVNDRNAEVGLPILAITQEHGAIPRELIDYHVSVTDKSLESYKVVNVGDFIISLRSFQGGIEYSRYQGICSPAYVVLRRRPAGNDAYFKHYLKTDRFVQLLTKNLEGLRDGKMISYKQFSELLVPVPSPPEQQKIADCLSSLDELITAQARKVKALKTHKMGLMQQLFPRDGEAKPRLRFPEFENAGDWTFETLESMCTAKISYGIVQAGPHQPDGMPYIKSSDLNSELGGAQLSRTSDTIAEKYRRSEVKPGDLVFSLRGNIGVSRIVPKIIPIANLTQGTARIRARGPYQFLLYALQHQPVHNKILAASKGSTFREISLGALRKIPMLRPKTDEQQRIADCFSGLETLINAAANGLDALKIHKKGLMQQLFPSPEALDA